VAGTPQASISDDLIRPKGSQRGGAEALSRMSEFRPVKTTLWLFSFLYGVASTGLTAPIYSIAISVDCPSSNVGPAVPAGQPHLYLGFILSSEAEDLRVACLLLSLSVPGPMHTHQSHQLAPPCSPGEAASSDILDKLFSESLGKSLATPPSAPPPPFHGIHSIKTVLFSPSSVKGDLSAAIRQ
jgi:hypothetical protein